MSADKVSLRFDFTRFERDERRLEKPLYNVWTSAFYGFVKLEINGQVIGDDEGVLWLTHTLLQALNDVFFFAKGEINIGYLRSQYYLALKKDKNRFLIRADMDRDRLWGDSEINTSCDILEFAAQVSQFHVKAMKQVVKLYPELLQSPDFIDKCFLARQVFGEIPGYHYQVEKKQQ